MNLLDIIKWKHGRAPGKPRSDRSTLRDPRREAPGLPAGIPVIHRRRPAGRLFLPNHATWLALLALVVSCGSPLPEDVLVVTQLPVNVAVDSFSADLLDARYPPGSRVVVVSRGAKSGVERVLSAGLHSAGGPVVGPEGDRVLFMGKNEAKGTWQIYESPMTRGAPVARTTMPGGAMDPVYLPDGRIAFSSPVPGDDREPGGKGLPELYAKRPGDSEFTRLTFGLAGAFEPTVLADGRLLFVSGGTAFAPITNQSLFTINSDGTEISPFAAQHDGRRQVKRPRQTDGEVLFLSAEFGSTGWDGQLEQVRAARPSSSRATVRGTAGMRVRAAEPVGGGVVLVTVSGAERPDFGVYALNLSDATGAGRELVFDDPAWDEVEVAVRPRGGRPMGRLSTVNEKMQTGQLLCLDANDIGGTSTNAVARSVRFFRPAFGGALAWFDEIPLQADGSFLAEVPADTLLGLETLDADGRVVGRLPPSFWVRPGENRSCIGCHEAHNSCPENRRPLAVKQTPIKLVPAGGDMAHQPPMNP